MATGLRDPNGIIVVARMAGAASDVPLLSRDVIRSVNGQRIQTEDDVRRLYEQFNQTRQTAWVVFEGRRNDAPLRLRYTVQP